MSKSVKPAAIQTNESHRTAASLEYLRVAKSPSVSPFPIVGIGASAGGLEALELFLGHVPDKSGMAFVVIQHHAPTQKSMLPELLQRTTTMDVFQARSHMKVKPNCVYLSPPNADLSILHGTLHLLDPVAPHGLRLPIDLFFLALAEDQRERSIGVILSGMGSDGTLGLRAIKEKSGLVLVQDPGSAKFDSMPKSVIDAGLADIIATAQELPVKIVEYIRRALPGGIALEPESNEKMGTLDKIFILLRARTGHDFSLYKKSTIYRRVERRMGLHQLARITDYARYLRENPQEIDLLFKELLIGVTRFFRDPTSWAYLQEHVLPSLLSGNSAIQTIRAWVPACSTGEEAYTLAMLLKEALEQVQPKFPVEVQIFATDLDVDAINKARQGFYPANIAADLSEERLSRFFVKEGAGYRVGKEIREMVIFAPQNVIIDPPFTKLNLVTCRNLLIYLGPELQQKLLSLFHYCLNPGGILFLGSAENVGDDPNLFIPLEAQARIYQCSDSDAQSMEMKFHNPLFPVQPALVQASKNAPAAVNLQSMADRLLLQQFSPAAVLVNSEGDILYINGHTGKYLEPAAGRANWNIYAMAREGLRQALALMLPQALRVQETLTQPALAVDINGVSHTFNLTVQAIKQPETLRGMLMIVFSDVSTPESAPVGSGKRTLRRGRMAELERALQQAREVGQRVFEEMQIKQEEIKSTNEELQSTNDELAISKEEMQSLNEELQTVNFELQAKLNELSHEKDDLDNLFNSTDIATVFLDNALQVRRFTSTAKQLFRLTPNDVGRPLSDFATDLNYPSLSTAAQEVLRTLVTLDKQVPTHDGRWFKVRILPYRTLNNMIAGVLITLVDITEIKSLEMELHKMQIVANVIELRDPNTAGHERWVAGLACAIASELGLDQDRINGLHLGGIVHDIGKVQIPFELLRKSVRLSEVERQLVKTHAQASYDILKDIHFPWPIADMVLQHHERLDGSGYPNGLKGDAIMLEARILGVADVVEAMSTSATNRAGHGIDVALAEIEKNRGVAYDTAVVNACLNLFRTNKFSFERA